MLIAGIDLKEMLPVFPLDNEFMGLPAVADWIKINPNASVKSSLFIIRLLPCMPDVSSVSSPTSHKTVNLSAFSDQVQFLNTLSCP